MNEGLQRNAPYLHASKVAATKGDELEVLDSVDDNWSQVCWPGHDNDDKRSYPDNILRFTTWTQTRAASYRSRTSKSFLVAKEMTMRTKCMTRWNH